MWISGVVSIPWSCVDYRGVDLVLVFNLCGYCGLCRWVETWVVPVFDGVTQDGLCYIARVVVVLCKVLSPVSCYWYRAGRC